MDLKAHVEEKVKAAKEASIATAKMDTPAKNAVLRAIASALDKNRADIIADNSLDLKAGAEKGLSGPMMDRLALNDKRIGEMIKAVNDVVKLPDPVGQVTAKWKRPNGLVITKRRAPLGVIGFIFEARPNVWAEVAALTLKSGNAVVMRGGSDAFHSNMRLARVIREAIKNSGAPENAVGVIEDPSREAVLHLVKMKRWVDVIIPRGGKQLIDFIDENSLIPVIRHDMGICHVFVDESANLKMALKICFNAKVQRPAVCNSMETMLVHKNIADKFLPEMGAEFKKAGVEMRGDDEALKLLPWIKKASEEDYRTEYNALILNIKVVASLDAAISHINEYGSRHSDSIVTEDRESAERFLREVDSAAVYHNASTRFTDGNEFGLGAEMGISNQKLHVRGPLALEGLTSEKFVVYGKGQVRE